MANRTLGTRQKLVFRGPDKAPGGGPKSPRNPLVVPALQRKAGPHDKTAGSSSWRSCSPTAGNSR